MMILDHINIWIYVRSITVEDCIMYDMNFWAHTCVCAKYEN